MLFNSFEFLWLFPIIFCIYVVVAYRNKLIKKTPGIANYVLIAISYALYIKWKPVYALILLGVTAITYLFALLIEKNYIIAKKYAPWDERIRTIKEFLTQKGYDL